MILRLRKDEADYLKRLLNEKSRELTRYRSAFKYKHPERERANRELIEIRGILGNIEIEEYAEKWEEEHAV